MKIYYVHNELLLSRFHVSLYKHQRFFVRDILLSIGNESRTAVTIAAAAAAAALKVYKYEAALDILFHLRVD